LDTEIVDAYAPGALEQAARLLQAGELVAFPTDTVYGVGALVNHRSAIERLYAVKEREQTKAIAVLLADAPDLEALTGELNPLARQLVEQFWPGPLTLVVPRHPSLPENLSSTPTLGVRMPDHPIARGLMRLTGPLATTSANLSGQPSTVTAQQVNMDLAGRIPLILDGGQTPGGQPSTVVDCTGGEPIILRAGPISFEAILSASQNGEQPPLLNP
jgi:L-threonylcarbamoyladenylate synthase